MKSYTQFWSKLFLLKRYFVFIVIILTAFVGEAQTRFNKIINSDINEICDNVIVREDGYIMCIGSDTLGYRCFRLVKLDLQGNLLWSKKIGYPGELWYDGLENSMFNTLDGGFALVGTHIRGSGHSFECISLVKFDSEGDTICRYSYPLSNSFTGGFHGIQTIDSGYAFCGYICYFKDSTLSTYYPAKAILIKTDSIGNMQWFKVFGGVEYDFASFYKIIQTDDGGYMLGGAWNNSTTESNDMYLVKTDSLGNEQWHKGFGGSYYDLAIKGLILTEGGAILTGHNRTYSSTSDDLVTGNAKIIKVLNDGTIIWDKEFEVYFDISEPKDSSYALFLSVVELSNFNLAVICRNSHISSQNYLSQCSLFMLNSAGDSLWTRQIQYPHWEMSEYNALLKVIKQTSDGGFIMAGETEHNTNIPMQQAWVVKTDSLGNDGTFIKEYKLPEVEVSLYPNPTDGKFSLELIHSNVNKEFTVKVFSLSGSLITEQIVKPWKPASFDISEYNSGLYLITAEENGRIVWASKVIKL